MIKNKLNYLKNNNKSYLENDIYRWLNNSKIRCKKSTFSNYQYTVNSRIIPKFSKIKKKNITSEIIDNYTFELLDEGLLPKTVKDILIILKQILTFAGIKVKVSMPKTEKKVIQVLDRKDQMVLENYIRKNINRITVGILICLYTGIRIGELCALKEGDIDLKNKKITIKKTLIRIKNLDNHSDNKTNVIIDNPKSSCSVREIPIPKFIVPILKDVCLKKDFDAFLLTGTKRYIETRTYFNKYKKILNDLQLPNYNFHALRHTFATRCIENGCDPKTLSEILGHSSVKITLERYVHPSYDNKIKMMNKLKFICN